MVYVLFLFNNGDFLVSQGTREEDDVVSEDLVEQDAQVSVTDVELYYKSILSILVCPTIQLNKCVFDLLTCILKECLCVISS